MFILLLVYEKERLIMNENNLIFAKHFSEIRRKPKIFVKFIFILTISLCTSIITSINVDFEKMYRNLQVQGDELEKAKNIGIIGGTIGGVFLNFTSLFLIFIILFLIDRIMRHYTKKKAIFSSALSYILITNIVSFIINIIQWLFKIPIDQYTISSLNIFDEGNNLLKVFDIQLIISGYLLFLILNKTLKFNVKSSLIITLILVLLRLAISIFFTTVTI